MSDKQKGKSHAFSIILIMIVLMLVGAACIPLLNVQYEPKTENLGLSVDFGGKGSARVIESEITSVIEGALNTVAGVSSIRATSRQNGGYINLTFKKGTDMETTRFDVSTRLRQIRSRLPEDAWYRVSGSSGGGGRGKKTLLSYSINADMPATEIVRYVQDHLVTPLSRIEGVDGVEPSGAEPFEWVLTFDPNSLRAAGLNPSVLSNAISRYFRRSNEIVGTEVVDDNLMLVRLRTMDARNDMESIPVTKVGDRLYYVGDFATISYQERIPNYYRRINGLNMIGLTIMGQEDINIVTVAAAAKQKMEELKASMPDNFAVKLEYDGSENLSNEIEKIFFRAVMSLAILLMFVLLVSRSFRYLLVIGLTITVNILSAMAFYKLFGVSIELYSMAGITVSLGIIIDTAIVIADHYTYYGDRKVMFSISGALFTTIAALMLIFFLPEESRNSLTNFIWVIVINLTLSMIIAFLFVPALLEYLPLKNKGVVQNSMKRMRRLVRRTRQYERIVSWGRSHRWVYIVGLLLLFGIPVQLLPSQVKHKEYDEDGNNTKGGLVGLYNKTIGGKWYQRNKAWFEYPLGGAFNLFQKHSGGRMSFGRQEEDREVVLSITANMDEGQTVQQLNEIVKEMENWLQQFDEIKDFTTYLSGTQGQIEIHFKDEYQKSRFPFILKQQMWAKATRYGGATWYIPSLGENDDPLYNSVYRTYWSNSISLYGYNYDLLYRYAEDLIDTLKANRRVNGQAGFSSGYSSFVRNEFYLDFDEEKIIRTGTNLNRYFSFLSDQLYNSYSASVYDGHKETSIRLVSGERDYYDLWHIRNDMVLVDSINTRLNDVGSITKRRTGLDIERNNQEYVINVGYEFIGSWDLRSRMANKLIKRLNETLPMGFHAGGDSDYVYWSQQKQRTVLIFVVILVIFMICAILFESFRSPLVIVILIPVSFIGMFLAYPLIHVGFDQGGFAAMIMLCGITVNAGIYLTSEYNTIAGATGKQDLKTYIKAFNRKIIPTMLTILSTVLGLIPFLFDGRDSQFWFSFAIGVMSGMLFSVVAIVFVMPVFFPVGKSKLPALGNEP